MNNQIKMKYIEFENKSKEDTIAMLKNNNKNLHHK